MPDIVYMDDSLATEFPVSPPLFEAPFEDQGVNIDYILRQTFQQLKANRVKLAIGTAHPDYADFLLVGEGPERDLQGLVVEWQRTYAKVPADFERVEGIANYTFPGLITPDADVFRLPTTLAVQAVVKREFKQTNTPETALPLLNPQRYVLRANPEFDASFDGQAPVVADAAGNVSETLPNLTEYRALVAAGTKIIYTCSVDLWMGNIWMRKTVRVVAK